MNVHFEFETEYINNWNDDVLLSYEPGISVIFCIYNKTKNDRRSSGSRAVLIISPLLVRVNTFTIARASIAFFAIMCYNKIG